jgi:hypothetical protein
MDEIREVFSQLFVGGKSREEIAIWANKLRIKNNKKLLMYLPPQQETLIKDCIIYLCGVDMKEDLDDQYLHFIEDFKDFFHSKINN